MVPWSRRVFIITKHNFFIIELSKILSWGLWLKTQRLVLLLQIWLLHWSLVVFIHHFNCLVLRHRLVTKTVSASFVDRQSLVALVYLRVITRFFLVRIFISCKLTFFLSPSLVRLDHLGQGSILSLRIILVHIFVWSSSLHLNNTPDDCLKRRLNKLNHL